MKPLCLDLFCKAGGTSRGYQQAGFYVVGVDIEAQKNYIGDDFLQADALEVLRILIGGGCIIGKSGREYWLSDFSLIAASPPCQGYTKAQKIMKNTHADLIEPTRKLLKETGRAYVIENVPGAPLINPIVLVGTMFDLMTVRERLFETNFYIAQPAEPLPRPRQVKMGRRVKEGDYIQPVGHFSNVGYARKAMGIGWMTRDELKEAIPPAYTKWLGQQMIELIKEPTQ
jgi:DNA (cytosine-5)-methyltransferase 1